MKTINLVAAALIVFAAIGGLYVALASFLEWLNK